MRNKGSLLSTLIILAAGVILCFAYNIQESVKIIIFIAGASFLIASIVNIVMLCDNGVDSEGRKRRSTFNNIIGWIASAGGAAVGVTMLVTPMTFAHSLVYVFGGILTLAAIYQLIITMKGLPGYRYGGWMYIMPLIMLGIGATLLCYPYMRDPEAQKWVVLLSGSGLILFAMTSLFTYISIARYNGRVRRGEPLQPVHVTADDEKRENTDKDEIEPSL